MMFRKIITLANVVLALIIVSINVEAQEKEGGTDPNTHIIGHWQFNDITNPGKDNSNAKNDLNINGNPIVKSGEIFLHGGRIELPKDKQDFLYSNSSDFHLGNESFTVECWFKSPTIIYTKLIGTRKTIRTVYPYLAGWALGLSKGDGAITFVVNDNNNKCSWAKTNTAKSSWDEDEWNYLVGVRDRNEKTVKLYLNGELVDSKMDECSDIGKSNDLTIGSDSYTGYLTEGALKNIRISKKVLSADEIAKYYTQNTTSLETEKAIILKDNITSPTSFKIDITDGLNSKLNIQPQPIKLVYSKKYTKLKPSIYIQLPDEPTAQQQAAAKILISDCKSLLKINLEKLELGQKVTTGTIIKLNNSTIKSHSESYRLSIHDDDNVTNINLSSADHGIIYGALTLIQILEQSTLIENMQTSIPTQLEIYDYPKIPRRIQVRRLSRTLTDSNATIHAGMLRIARERLNYYNINISEPSIANLKRFIEIANIYGVNVIASAGYVNLRKQFKQALTIEDIGPILEKLAEAAKIGCKGFTFHFDDLAEYEKESVDFPGGVGGFQRQFLVAMQDVAQKHGVSFVSMCPTMYMREWPSAARTWFGDPKKYADYFKQISSLPGGDIEVFYTDIADMSSIEKLGVRRPAYYLNGAWGSKRMLGVYTGLNRLTWSWYGFNVDPIKGPMPIPETIEAWRNIAKNGIETVWSGTSNSKIVGMWMWNPAEFNEENAIKEINRSMGLGAGAFNELLIYEKNTLPLVALFKTYIGKATSEFHIETLGRQHELNTDDLITYWGNYQRALQAFKNIEVIISHNHKAYRPNEVNKIIKNMQNTLDLFKTKLIRKLKNRNIIVE